MIGCSEVNFLYYSLHIPQNYWTRPNLPGMNKTTPHTIYPVTILQYMKMNTLHRYNKIKNGAVFILTTNRRTEINSWKRYFLATLSPPFCRSVLKWPTSQICLSLDRCKSPIFQSIVVILSNFSFAFPLLFAFSVIRQLNAIDGILYRRSVTPITTNRTDGELGIKLENKAEKCWDWCSVHGKENKLETHKGSLQCRCFEEE